VEFDFYVSLMNLPAIFETTLETVPADVPYIHADSAKVELWRDRFAETAFKVGIAWAGNPTYGNDQRRSCALEHFGELAKIEGVKLYGLQKGAGSEQAKGSAGAVIVENLGEEFEDFTDTAGAIENLDLIISVDTAVLHLAGAMGKPVWALLPFAPDWRWILNRQDSPWYPTMRLFRQTKQDQWDDVFQCVAEQLQILTSKQRNENQ
jgi:hypothetical protein